MRRAVYIVGGMNAGGAETVFMKYYRKLDKSRYQMDFCVSDDEPGFYDDEIRSLGGNIVHTVKKTRNPLKSYKRLKEIAAEGDYCCAVRSTQRSLSAIDLAAMRRGCAKTRLVFRSSNTGTTDGDAFNEVMHRLFKPLATRIPDVCVAPSAEAGLYMFGRRTVRSTKFCILHNALDLSEYAYSEADRARVRAELGIPTDAVAVGHVGRFNQQKNHGYLLNVFSEFAFRHPDALLVLFGKGELRDEVSRKAVALGLRDKVIFAGIRRDVGACYSAMDVLAFPSRYEGLPNVVVEAQANGLPCLISDTITREVVVNENVQMLSLVISPSDWADALGRLAGSRVPDPAPAMRAAGYDIDRELAVFIDIIFGSGSHAEEGGE